MTMTMTERVPVLHSLMLVLLVVCLTSCAPDDPAPPRDTPTTAALPIRYGEQACDACVMVIGVPGSAAQATAADGRVLSFDDPGCLVLEVVMGRLASDRALFRHADEDRWLALDEVAFVRRDGTPMDFGYAAVDRADGELTFDEVRAEMDARFGPGR